MVSLNIGLSVLSLVSFILLYVIFTKFFWKPILGAIKDREEMISIEIESTKKALEKAEQLRDEQENVLLQAKQEAENMIAEAKRTAQRVRADIVETAKLETQIILQQANLRAEFEKNKVLESLKQDITGLTLLATQKVLERVVTEKENREIIEKTVNAMVER